MNTNKVYSSISNLLTIAEETTANSEQTTNVSDDNLEKNEISSRNLWRYIRNGK